MNFVYHRVPDNIRGNILHPLNILKNLHPEAYEQAVNKYNGREQVMEQRITILDCAWGDVLHFTAVHPNEIAGALNALGQETHFKSYEIDASILDPKNTVFYLYGPRGKGEQVDERDIVPFNPSEVEKFAHLPQATKAYYQEVISKGGRPLLYHRVPHVLHKGSIDISSARIVEV
jgi:hypothetical protein